MLTQTHLTLELLKDYQSLQGITKHYERLKTVHEVYEEVRRYTRTTFTMKRRNLKKDNRGKLIYSFF